MLIIMIGRIKRLFRRILYYLDVIVCNSFLSSMDMIKHQLSTDKLPLALGNIPVFILRARARWIMRVSLSTRKLQI